MHLSFRPMLDCTAVFPIHVYALSLARLAFLHTVIIIHAYAYAFPDYSTVPSAAEEIKRRLNVGILHVLCLF